MTQKPLTEIIIMTFESDSGRHHFAGTSEEAILRMTEGGKSYKGTNLTPHSLRRLEPGDYSQLLANKLRCNGKDCMYLGYIQTSAAEITD